MATTNNIFYLGQDGAEQLVANVKNLIGDYALKDETEAALGETVKFTAQSLTDEQKAQARENIGIVEGVSSWNDLTDKPFYVQSNDTVLLDGEFTTEYISTYGVYGIDTAYNEELEAAPEKVTMIYDGVEYKDLTFTDIPDLGKVGGNLYHMNALFGTSYENTGEPFILAVTQRGCGIMTLDITETAHIVKLFIEGEPIEKINPSCLPEGYPYVGTNMVAPVFDGDMTGWETVDMGEGFYLIKASSQYVPITSLIGSTAVCNYKGEQTVTITEGDITDVTERNFGIDSWEIFKTIEVGSSTINMPIAAGFSDDVTSNGLTISAGVWFLYANDVYTKSLSCLNTEQEVVHKLDNKFIDAEWMATTKMGRGKVVFPETTVECISSIGNGGISIDENDSRYVKIKLTAGKTYIFSVDDVEHEIVAEYIESENLYYAMVGENLGIQVFNSFIILVCGSTGMHTFGLYERAEVIEKLPVKYLPDGVPYIEKVVIDPTFDGNIAGRETVLVQEGTYAVKVSTQYEPVEEMIGATMVLNIGGAEQTVSLTAENTIDATNVLGVPGAVVVQGTDPIVLSFPTDTEIIGMTLSAGTWFMCMVDQFHVKSLSCLSSGEQEVVHKIDPKYLPVGYPYIEDGVTILEETDITADDSGNMLLEEDVNLTLGNRYTVIYNGTEYVCEAVDSAIAGTAGAIFLGNYSLGMDIGDTGEPFIIVYMATFGMQVYDINGANSCRLAIESYGNIHKIDPMYLPDMLPEVDSSNEGAFLRVVNGSWAIATLSNVEDGEF